MKYLNYLIEKKQKREKISMLTAYDYISAKILEEVGIDVILVGDSYGMVKLGYDTTLPVTMEEMLIISKAVSKAINESIFIIDLPFLSYQASVEQAVYNSGRFFKETKVQAVKIESNGSNTELIRTIVNNDIPVIGHIGLTPQSIFKLGGYKIQGKDAVTATKVYKLAKNLEDAGVSAIVLECMTGDCAGKITEDLNIPTIGIGAGPHCDGQVLVLDDLLGINHDFSSRHIKKYVDLYSIMKEAVKEYRSDVRTKKFPNGKNYINMEQGELKKFNP